MWNWLRRLLGLGEKPAPPPPVPEPQATDRSHRDVFPETRSTRPPRKIVAYDRVVQVDSQSAGSAAAANGATLALVTGDNGPKWLMMRCPCGCGEIRRISLSPKVPPTWRLRVEPGPLVSLSPSVNLKGECRAHFILTRNRALVV